MRQRTLLAAPTLLRGFWRDSPVQRPFPLCSVRFRTDWAPCVRHRTVMTTILAPNYKVTPSHLVAPSSQRLPQRDTRGSDPRANRLLGALAESGIQRWLPHLEAVDMPLGMVLRESGRPLKYAYFPTTSIAAMMYGLEDGHTGAVSLVGNEGMAGISMFMGGGSMLGQTVVISAGRGFRMLASPLTIDFERGGPVASLMLRYAQAAMTQLAQVVVCNRHHCLDQRLCRFLLSALDRLEAGSEFMMTQELISSVLGVRREGVTEAALSLQRAGLIHYERGHMRVLDRAGLQARTCECYDVVMREYERLLPRRSVQ